MGVGGVFVCRSFVSEWATWKRFESSLQHGNPFVNTPATTKGIRALLKCTTYSPEDKGWFLASAIKEKLVYGGEKEDTVKIACDLLLEDPQFYAVLPHLLSRSSSFRIQQPLWDKERSCNKTYHTMSRMLCLSQISFLFISAQIT